MIAVYILNIDIPTIMYICPFIILRLSAAMNRQMSRDETDLENINVKNRPMKILQEYELFCSQEWLEAKGDLDESAERMNPRAPLSEGDRCTLLCMVLTVCVFGGRLLI